MYFKKFAEEVTGTWFAPQFIIIDIAVVEDNILLLGPNKNFKEWKD